MDKDDCFDYEDEMYENDILIDNFATNTFQEVDEYERYAD